MIKKLVLLLLIVYISSSVVAQRPKVGLVLGGGGAKGAAHVGALKVIEEAGIPIDYIAGTSIGAIIGGLYAIGYSVDELDSLFRTQDWTYLLSDKLHRNYRSFPSKEVNERYLLSLPFSKSKETPLPAGMIAGQNILNLFSGKTIGYHNVESFDSLPIPFACVAIDLVSGKDVVLNKGSLPLAMRSSMSIPGVFAPVESDGMILIDGGSMNNLPTNVVKDMGAEIIIGIDLTTGWRSPEEVKAMTGMIDQLTNIMGDNHYQKNKSDLDLYLNPNLKGYSAASFTRIAIDTMILRGEEIARDHWGELMELKQKIYSGKADSLFFPSREAYSSDSLCMGRIIIEGISPNSEKLIRRKIRLKENSSIVVEDIDRAISTLYGMDIFTNVEYKLTDTPPYDLHISLKDKPLNNLNIGVRFDTEDMASILLNTTLNANVLRGTSIAATTRLSQNPYINVFANIGKDFTEKAGLSYTFKYNDFNLFSSNKKIDNLSFISQSGEFNYSRVNRNLTYNIGLHYDYFSYDDKLYNYNYQPVDVHSEGFFNYFASLSFENYDSKYYPTKGLYTNIQGQLFTDNMVTYNANSPFGAITTCFVTAISLTNRLCLLPSIHGRFLIGDEIPPIYQNYMGGNINGRYLPQQMSFSGISYVQLFEANLLLTKLALRYRFGFKHYVTAMGEFAKDNDKFTSIFDGNNIWGTSLRYSYNTIVGPIGLEVNYSNIPDEVGVYFFLGYHF